MILFRLAIIYNSNLNIIFSLVDKIKCATCNVNWKLSSCACVLSIHEICDRKMEFHGDWVRHTMRIHHKSMPIEVHCYFDPYWVKNFFVVVPSYSIITTFQYIKIRYMISNHIKITKMQNNAFSIILWYQ